MHEKDFQYNMNNEEKVIERESNKQTDFNLQAVMR